MEFPAIDLETGRPAARARRRFSARFTPLGIALQVEADSLDLIEVVGESCRNWEAAVQTSGPKLHLDLELGPVDPQGEASTHIHGQRLSLRGGVEAWADGATGRAGCRVGSADHFSDLAFRERNLDGLILWLLTRHGRTPLHASAFAAGGMAVVLAGRSGSGKSCLAHAADKAGLALLTDDTVYVETEGRFRLWGMPRPIHLYPQDAPGDADSPIRLRNGKHKRALQPASLGQAAFADRGVLCVLRRGDQVSLQPIDQDEALAALGPPEAGFDLLTEDIDQALRRLTRLDAWRLTLSADPDEAIRLLTASLPRLAARATS